MFTILAGVLALALAHAWMECTRPPRIDAAEEGLRADRELYAVDPEFAGEMGYSPPKPLTASELERLEQMRGAFQADRAAQMLATDRYRAALQQQPNPFLPDLQHASAQFQAPPPRAGFLALCGGVLGGPMGAHLLGAVGGALPSSLTGRRQSGE